MAQESQLAHRVLTNLALPYITNVSPANTDPHFVSGSTDILTTINGYAERRPGFATAVETTPTTFNNLQRLFPWDRFDGTFIIMACDINSSGFAQVFKLQVGLDVSFVPLYTDPSATPFDFVVSNNTVYFANGVTALKYDPVNGLSNWGIAVGSVNNSVGPNTAATGVTIGAGAPWTNPGNVSSNVSFATLTLPTGGSVNSLHETSGGTGYFSGATIDFTGGGGSGAMANAAVQAGHVTSMILTAGGSGYTSAPTVVVSGAGTGAHGTCTIGGGVTNNGQSLQGSNFSLGLTATEVVNGISVNFTAIVTLTGGGSATLTCPVQLIVNGSAVGTAKPLTLITDGASHTYNLGGATDLWGTNLNASNLNSSSFGFQITPSLSSITGGYTAAFQADNFQVTITGVGGPTVTQVGTGSFSAQFGYTYEFCYGNSNTGHISSPTPTSNNTGVFGGAISTSTLSSAGSGYAANDTGVVLLGNVNATYKILTVSGSAVLTYSITVAGTGYTVLNHVATATAGSQPGAGTGFSINITGITGIQNLQISLTSSTDGQVNQIHLYRTVDGGGGTYFEIPSSPYPNTSATFTSVANAVAGSTVYTGRVVGNPLGQSFLVAGFTNGANNGLFTCTAYTLTTMTLNNAAGVAETHAATATLQALDSAADASLIVSSIAPIPTFNDPPTPFRGMVYFSSRIWGFTGNKVWFSGLEEITQGVPEESFPSGVAGNFWAFDEPVQGLGVAGIGNNQTLVILCGGRLYGIQGNTLDTFRRFLVSNRRGARNLTCVTSMGGMVAWLDSANQVWATDGNSLEELSTLIRNDLSGITQANCSLTFHTAGRFHWLVLSTGTKLYVYDVDQDQWMPPWTFAAQYVYSGEISAGNYVLMAAIATKALQMSTTAFNDNGSVYAPVMRTNLFSVIPDYGTRFSYIGTGSYNEPTRTGYPVTFQLTNNGQSIPGFAICNDENTSTAVYNDITANLVDTSVAFNRTNGTSLVQKVYQTTQPAARWIGIQVTLSGADQVDNLYELFLAYKPLGGR